MSMNDSSASRWAAAAAEAAKRVSKVRSKLDDASAGTDTAAAAAPPGLRKTTTVQHAYEKGRFAQQTSNMEASLQQGLAELDAVRSFLRDGINRCNTSFMQQQQQQQQQQAPVPSGGAAAGAAGHQQHQHHHRGGGDDSGSLQATLQKGLSELEEVRHKLLASLASATRGNAAQQQQQQQLDQQQQQQKAAAGAGALPLGSMKRRTTTMTSSSGGGAGAAAAQQQLQGEASHNNSASSASQPPQHKTAAGSARTMFTSRPGSAPAARRADGAAAETDVSAASSSGGAGVNNTSSGSGNVGGASWGDRMMQRAHQRRMSRHRQALESAGTTPNAAEQEDAAANPNQQQQQPPPTNISSFRKRPGAVQVPSRLGNGTGSRPSSAAPASSAAPSTTFQQGRFNNSKTNKKTLFAAPAGKLGQEDEPVIIDDDDDDDGVDEMEDIIRAATAAKKKNPPPPPPPPAPGQQKKREQQKPPAPPVRPASASVHPTTAGAAAACSSSSPRGTVPLSNFHPKFGGSGGPTTNNVPTPPPDSNNNSSSGAHSNGSNGAGSTTTRPFSAQQQNFRPASAGIRSALRRPGSATASKNSGNGNAGSSSSSSYFPGGEQQRGHAATPTKISAANGGGGGTKQSLLHPQRDQQQQHPQQQQKTMCPEAQSLREQGNVQFQSKRYAEAVETYGRALQYEPQSETLLCNRAAAHLMLHHFSDALRDSQRAAEIDPSLTKAQWRAAKSALFLGQSDTAKHHYTVAQRQAFSQADADAIATELKMVDVAERCRRSLRGKDYGEALRAADALLQVFPPSSPCASVWLCLKVEALLPTDANDALSLAVSTTEADPLSAEGFIVRARATFYTGHDQTSTQAALGFLSTARNLDQACGAKAITLQAAIETFAKLRDDGNGAYTAGRWVDAHNAYSKCLTIDPNNVSLRAIILCNRAAVSIQRNMWQDALDDITDSIRLNPTNAKAFTRRARIHQHFGRVDQALSDLRTACSIFPSPENQERLQQALETKQQQQQQSQQQNQPSSSGGSGFYSRPGSAATGGRPSSAQSRRPGSAAPGGGGPAEARSSANQGFRFFAFGASGAGGASSRPSSASGFRGSRPQSAGGNQQQQQAPPPAPVPRGPCLYTILGVTRGADEKTIITAYRAGALKYHPDKCAGMGDDERKHAEAKFKDIANAYNILRDATKRRQYDAGGHVS